MDAEPIDSEAKIREHTRREVLGVSSEVKSSDPDVVAKAKDQGMTTLSFPVSQKIKAKDMGSLSRNQQDPKRLTLKRYTPKVAKERNTRADPRTERELLTEREEEIKYGDKESDEQSRRIKEQRGMEADETLRLIDSDDAIDERAADVDITDAPFDVPLFGIGGNGNPPQPPFQPRVATGAPHALQIGQPGPGPANPDPDDIVPARDRDDHNSYTLVNGGPQTLADAPLPPNQHQTEIVTYVRQETGSAEGQSIISPDWSSTDSTSRYPTAKNFDENSNYDSEVLFITEEHMEKAMRNPLASTPGTRTYVSATCNGKTVRDVVRSRNLGVSVLRLDGRSSKPGDQALKVFGENTMINNGSLPIPIGCAFAAIAPSASMDYAAEGSSRNTRLSSDNAIPRVQIKRRGKGRFPLELVPIDMPAIISSVHNMLINPLETNLDLGHSVADDIRECTAVVSAIATRLVDVLTRDAGDFTRMRAHVDSIMRKHFSNDAKIVEYYAKRRSTINLQGLLYLYAKLQAIRQTRAMDHTKHRAQRSCVGVALQPGIIGKNFSALIIPSGL